jgi:hypothetical protein
MLPLSMIKILCANDRLSSVRRMFDTWLLVMTIGVKLFSELND